MQRKFLPKPITGERENKFDEAKYWWKHEERQGQQHSLCSTVDHQLGSIWPEQTVFGTECVEPKHRCPSRAQIQPLPSAQVRTIQHCDELVGHHKPLAHSLGHFLAPLLVPLAPQVTTSPVHSPIDATECRSFACTNARFDQTTKQEQLKFHINGTVRRVDGHQR